MTQKVSESERMKMICEFIKTGKQPEGFKVVETKNGKYRLSKVKDERQALETKRTRLQQELSLIDDKLKEFEKQEQKQEDQH